MGRIILDLCGGTGAWGKPYKEAGYDYRNITLPAYDVLAFSPPSQVYGILAAPPCTEFSFAKHFHGRGNYSHDFSEGMKIVDACFRIVAECQPVFWALENPKGYLRQFLGQPALTFEPWWYGDLYRKVTDLWGAFNVPKQVLFERPPGLPKFSQLHSCNIAPEYYGILSRQVRRAITPKGFSEAFFEANP